MTPFLLLLVISGEPSSVLWSYPSWERCGPAEQAVNEELARSNSKTIIATCLPESLVDRFKNER